MRTQILAAMLLILAPVSAWPQEANHPKPAIPEEVVRMWSARAYADLLIQAYEKGWRYPQVQVENGFKRHFEEMKLQLIAQGYQIVAEDAGDKPHAGPAATEL
ncbi:hypothetical protein [Phyllobacterium lublinensis]|uniref:hypothetical protein n=1 Tax=Phyllobacterium lublinensis TaxID=2875708 RepID=UPI001CCC2C50|nr:hypothetical protein [Phyllobacterium sp. 2063]MBZ9653409.1 hypothetical protein [Phyllobacterium sp. 2063]